MNKVINFLYRNIVYIIFGIIILFLFIVSMFSSAVISSDWYELTYFLKDNIILNIFIVLLIGILFYIIKKKKIDIKINDYFEKYPDNLVYIEFGLYIFLFIIMLIFVFTSAYIVNSDQATIFANIASFREKDFSAFTPGNYLHAYPNNIGITLIAYLFSFIFGTGHASIFQLFNALFLVIAYKELVDILKLFGINKFEELLLTIILVFFLPFNLYVYFVYGNIIHLAFYLIAFKYEIKYFRDYHYKDLFIFLIAIFLAIFIKQNALIPGIAMALFAFMKIFDKEKIKSLIALVLIICFSLIGFNLPKRIVKLWTGIEIKGNLTMLSYLEMGLIDSDLTSNEGFVVIDADSKTIFTDGWWNGYGMKKVYRVALDNTEKQKEIVTEDLKETISYYKNNPKAFIKHTTIKITSQWNDANFQGFWNMQKSYSKKGYTILKTIMYPKVSYQITKVYDILLTLVYLGTLLFIIFSFNRHDNLEMYLIPVTFIGGFLFHLIWEAKCQYTVTYYMLLFPYMILGFKAFYEYLFNKKYKDIFKFNKVNNIIIVIINIIMFCLIGYSFTDGNYLTRDNEKYNDYLNDFGTIDEYFENVRFKDEENVENN